MLSQATDPLLPRSVPKADSNSVPNDTIVKYVSGLRYRKHALTLALGGRTKARIEPDQLECVLNALAHERCSTRVVLAYVSQGGEESIERPPRPLKRLSCVL